MTHALTLGATQLTASAPHEDYAYEFDVLADGVSFGVARGVQQVVTSLLADGDLVRINRYGNREVTFAVEITGPSLAALAQGEAALRREVGRGNTLTWQPPDDLAPATVFDVVTSEMSQTFNDIDELNKQRTFLVTLVCAPYASSAATITVTALSPPVAAPTTVPIHNADTTTGWAATGPSAAPVAVTDEGAYVQATRVGSQLTLAYAPGSPISTASTRYLLLELSGSVPSYFTLNTGSGYAPVTPSMTRATPSGTVIYVIDTRPATAFVGLSITHKGPSGATITINAHDLSRTDTLPQVSKRQTAATIAVGGTERTPGSIRVATGSLPMNFTVVHTSKQTLAGYAPPLRRWRVSGNTVDADPTLFSGARESVTLTPFEAQVPLMSMPLGDYALAAIMRSNTPGTFPITWTANSLIPGYGYLGPTISGVIQAKFTDAGFWDLIPIDVTELPPVRSTNALAVVQITLNRSPVGSEVIDLDEMWAFSIDQDSALTIVNNPTSRLWLDSPDVNRAVPGIWIGDFNNRADARHPGPRLIAPGNHTLHPDGTSIFVAANGADTPEVTASFRKRWHSNAAE